LLLAADVEVELESPPVAVAFEVPPVAVLVLVL